YAGPAHKDGARRPAEPAGPRPGQPAAHRPSAGTEATDPALSPEKAVRPAVAGGGAKVVVVVAGDEVEHPDGGETCLLQEGLVALATIQVRAVALPPAQARPTL